MVGGCVEGVYLWENGCEAVLYVGAHTPHGLSQSLFGELHAALPLITAYPLPPDFRRHNLILALAGARAPETHSNQTLDRDHSIHYYYEIDQRKPSRVTQFAGLSRICAYRGTLRCWHC